MPDDPHLDPAVAAAAQALAAFGRAVHAERLVASTCGNISVRVDAHRIAISGTGTEIACLTPDQIAVVSLADGKPLGGARPSMEVELHRRVYLVRPQVGAVLHGQSRAATAWACSPLPLPNLDLIPEVPAYVRAVGRVPYAQPGSEELAASVVEAFAAQDVTIVQMTNHGQVVVGSTWQHAVRRAVFMELACWMALQRLPLEPVPEAAAAALRTFSRDV